MKKLLFLLCIMAIQIVLFAPVYGDSIPLTILNNSFENTSSGWYSAPGGVWTQNVGITGWASTDPGMCGVISGFGETAPEGDNAAWVQGSNAIWQVLGDTLQSDSLYTLSVYVGNRSGAYSPDAEIQLWADGNLLIDYVVNPNSIVDNTYSQITLTFQSGHDVTPGQSLGIKLISTGAHGDASQPHFDMVTLSDPPVGVPEPSVLLFLGMGLLSLAGMGRRWIKKK
jgi:hypothetical protein